MSLRALLRPRSLAPLLRARQISTTPTPLLKESSSPHTDNPDPEALHRHKQDSLDKQKKGQGHWKPELASDSEESVKADRAPHEPGEAGVRKLQERTKAAAEETLKHGTSMKDSM
ncbi:hypothetical protein B0T25DRAFT_634733 [Lasiosphaeria hispida]|uniref:Mitochondrial carrier protein pet8 n=1 Tax=Lasiosphaeria hispida TaxID=260671 RepID=A0AAJ0H8Z5_9PEZI|nr:hypothetical protein B0T25DRAFT_634733 [Lasiosphaeria hispida]